MNNNFYGQNIGSNAGMNMMGGPMAFDVSQKQDMPMLSATSAAEGDGGQSAREVFMGVQSPQPGGWGGWKWTAMGSQEGQK